ncbi:MAG: hypothetical protein ACPGIA_09460 [Luteolibacter sp.]
MLLVAIAFFSASCERHDFEGPNGTKQLHGHGDHQDGVHGDGHGQDKQHH